MARTRPGRRAARHRPTVRGTAGVREPPDAARSAKRVGASGVAICGAGPFPSGALRIGTRERRRPGCERRVSLRIGIVSDIHCDIEAMTRALDEMGPVDLILGAGDFVLQYRFSNEIYDMIRDRRIVAVRGNHDQAIASSAGAALRASGKIHPEHLERLEHMPSVVELHVEGKRIVMMHTSRIDPTGGGRDLAATALGKVVHHYRHSGRTERVAHSELGDTVLTDLYTPGKVQNGSGQYVTIAHDDGMVRTYVDMPEARADIVVVGHTHQPSISVEKGTLVINPGSLGQPRNPAFPHRRTYAVLDTDGWVAELGEFEQAAY